MSKNNIEKLIECPWFGGGTEDFSLSYYKVVAEKATEPWREFVEIGSVDIEREDIHNLLGAPNAQRKDFWIVQFWGDFKCLQPYFHLSNTNDVELAKKEVDEFLIRISKLKIFL